MVEVNPAFRRRLQIIPEILRRRLRPVMEKSADELVEMMRTLVPVDDGDLRASIGWTWGDAPKGALVLDELKTKGDKSSRIVIYAGNEKAYYAAWVEFGTSPHSVATNASVSRQKRQGQGAFHPGATASPFFWPAYRALKNRIKSRITRAIRAAIRESSGVR